MNKPCSKTSANSLAVVGEPIDWLEAWAGFTRLFPCAATRAGI